MLKAAGYNSFIPKADAVTKKIKDRLAVTEKDLIDLLDRSCITVALSLDGWTSQNNLSIFAINGT
jgi:hypothetical protein